MKHDAMLSRLAARADQDLNVFGFLEIRPYASDVHRENSKIDPISVLQTGKLSSPIRIRTIERIARKHCQKTNFLHLPISERRHLP